RAQRGEAERRSEDGPGSRWARSAGGARYTAPPMPTQLRRGSRLGKYRLDRRLDRGGFAEVWKARDTVEGRSVALKVSLPGAVEEWGREEIEREARIASQLHHPNVMAVRNADWIDGRFAIATDLAVANLEKYRRAWRSGAVALDVIRQIAA